MDDRLLDLVGFAIAEKVIEAWRRTSDGSVMTGGDMREAARAAIAIAYPAGVAAGREEAQAEVAKLRTALITMGRMLPGVILDDRVSSDFLSELPAEMGHYHLMAPSEATAIRQRGE